MGIYTVKSNTCNFDEELPNFGREFTSSSEHILDRVTGRFSPLLLKIVSELRKGKMDFIKIFLS
jgi:hypothetical protein